MNEISDRWPRVWCPNCGEVRPVILDVLLANDMNPRAALDLVCAECVYIVATLHEATSPEHEVRP